MYSYCVRWSFGSFVLWSYLHFLRAHIAIKLSILFECLLICIYIYKLYVSFFCRECLDPFDEPECEAFDLFVNEILCIGKGIDSPLHFFLLCISHFHFLDYFSATVMMPWVEWIFYFLFHDINYSTGKRVSNVKFAVA